jgi:predicted RecB family nuclease
MKIIEGRARVAASDVANFLACQQLTQLDLQKARGTLQPPHARDLGFEDLVRRGEEHERAVLERFWADGYEVADLSGAADPAGTIAAAIRNGADVIYQGTLTGAGDATALLGRPDFLVRADLLTAPDGEARPDGRHYEVVDAKLARTAKARAVLQTAFYSRLLAELQGIEPRWMHLALGHGEFVSFKVRDFAAYERQTRRRLVQVLGAGPPAGLYPEPVIWPNGPADSCPGRLSRRRRRGRVRTRKSPGSGPRCWPAFPRKRRRGRMRSGRGCCWPT